MFLLLLQTVENPHAIGLTILMSLIYIAIVRFIDLNEKEPYWAIGLVFGLGAIAGALMALLISSTLLHLTVFPSALAQELFRFAGIAAGVGLLTVVGHLRGGASELNGLMDGVVYGASGGLGFAVGRVFIEQTLLPSGNFGIIETSALTMLWTTALTGLRDGLFGAIIGAAFGASQHEARSPAARYVYPIIGFIAAILIHAGYLILARGDALGGSSALVRTWLALLIPLIAIIVITVYALSREKRAIREQLADEAAGGIVTAEERAALQSFGKRQALQLKTLMSGNHAAWAGLRALHNRQVQLALAKSRAARDANSEMRAEAQAEVERLRQAVREIKSALAEHGYSTDAEGVKIS